MDELAVAHAIRDGQLPSPQRYENFWLFELRVTGTGAAYRSANDEFAYRPRETYLNDRFVERCSGLPVIMMHPEKKPMIDSVEYAKRNVGSIFVPYLKDDEVWCVAKIYDAAAAKLMSERQLSTSPAVFYRHPEVNQRVDVDGDQVLVEGQPSLLDHLAICEQGVWDKGGDPLGVSLVTTGDQDMAETKKDNDTENRHDAAEIGSKLDALLDAVTGQGSRLDAALTRLDAAEERFAREDKARKDAEEAEAKKREEEEAAKDKAKKDATRKDAETEEEKEALAKAEREKAEKDKAKKDADDKEEEEVKKRAEEEEAAKDKARKDAQAKLDADVAKRLADLERRIPVQLTDAQRSEFADAQARADAVASMFGAKAGRPLDGEALLTYRKRQARPFQVHSAAHKDLDLSVVPEVMWDNVESTIFADARVAATNPALVPAGELREMINTDRAGRRVSTFVGEPRSWMTDFMSPSKYVTSISKAKEAA